MFARALHVFARQSEPLDPRYKMIDSLSSVGRAVRDGIFKDRIRAVNVVESLLIWQIRDQGVGIYLIGMRQILDNLKGRCGDAAEKGSLVAR